MARPPRRPTAPADIAKPTPASTGAKSTTAKPGGATPARVKPTRASTSASNSKPAPPSPPDRGGGAAGTQRRTSLAAAQSQASAWMAGVRGSGFTLLIMGIMILAVIVLAPSVKTFVEQRAQIAELQQSVDDAKADAQSLDDEAARWSDPAYIRAQARDRLYYVMPGEISYLVLNDVTVPGSTDTAVTDEIQETRTDWVSSLLSSVVVSGTGEQTPEQLGGSDANTTTGPTTTTPTP
ncbi:septum formation initiator family protein [Microbacteriaceae bacterium VKM Ac-2855]|nr:septum formation initiator family protein [Microbacteriaceae bacterium VKM Ac-2855]